MSNPSRPQVRKSSPSPLPRAVDRALPARPLSPMTRAAGSLAIAAALVLGGAGALTGCGDDRTHREESGSSRRARADRDPSTRDRADAEGKSALDQFVNAVGELVSPSTDAEPAKRPVAEPVNDPPRPAGTMSPMSPTTAPRLAGSTSVAPAAPPPESAPRSRPGTGFGS